MSRDSAHARLAVLEAEWARRFAVQPKLPSWALLTGAFAMACGFGAVMFFCLAWVRGFQAWTVQLALFAGLSLTAGLLNRLLARRWYREIERWSAERQALAQELESLRHPVPNKDARKCVPPPLP